MKKLETTLRFRMLRRHPIPIQVEPVVVGTPSRPGFDMFSVLCILRGDMPPITVSPIDEPVAAIRIVIRIDNHDDAIQQVIYRRSLSGGQMIRTSIAASELLASLPWTP